MKGTTSHFESSYNKAESGDVKTVIEINDYDVTNHEQVPKTGTPNSVTRIYNNGKLIQERYYDENGDAYLDIDYTNHNNSKTHSIVPHQHKWEKDDKGILRRMAWEEINHDKRTS